MHWDGPNARARHSREPWTKQDRLAFVHCRVSEMKGTDSVYGARIAQFVEQHDRAKIHFDRNAALDIVERCISQAVLDELAELVFYTRAEPVFVFPHPAFDDEDEIIGNVALTARPTNALPFAYAHFLVENLGGAVNETIIQASRVGTTRLPRWMRYLCQPSFEGDVERRRPYIMLDDVISSGGTFATLRSFIVRNGGSVAGTTALASNTGLHEKFAIADDTLYVLQSEYGPSLDGFWQETFGHGIRSLTESEAQYLVRFARQCRETAGPELLHRLRERINQAAATCG
jgi:hypothetical protein